MARLLQNHPFTMSNLSKELRLDADGKGNDDPEEVVMCVPMPAYRATS
jgi:hypothetical protein